MSLPLNPYIAGNPVGDSDAFTGRADILREVLRMLPRPKDNAIVLYGQRRIGKTSVLQYLQKQVAQAGNYYPVYFDLQDKATLPLGEVLRDLAGAIASELQKEPPDLDDKPEETFQTEWLTRTLAELPEAAALVLLFDEFDVLAASSAQQAGSAFFPYLRRLIAGEPQRLNFVFVIGRNVNDLDTIALSLFKGVPSHRVSLLDKKDTIELIRLSEKNNTLRWTEQALDKVWQYTNGHAFFAQQVCFHAWQQTYDEEPEDIPEIDAEAVDAVIPEVLETSRNALEWLWDGLPPAERVVSSALAEAGQRAINESELEKILHESGVRIVIRELQDAPRLLQEWDLLESADDGYRFRVELLRRWIQENKPLRRVQEELDRIEPVAENLFQAAQGLYRSGQLEQAEPLLRQAIELNPNHVGANQLLADLLLAQGKTEKAKELLKRLYEYQPDAARSRLVQAWLGLAHQAGNEDDKLGCYEQVLKLDPKQTEAANAFKNIWQKRGHAALAEGDKAKALEAYQKADATEEVNKQKESLRREELDTHLKKLKELEQIRHYQEALKTAQNLADQFRELHNWQATLQRLNRRAKLETIYQQALGAIQNKDTGLAKKRLAQVIASEPDYAEAANHLYQLVNPKALYRVRRERRLAVVAILIALGTSGVAYQIWQAQRTAEQEKQVAQQKLKQILAKWPTAKQAHDATVKTQKQTEKELDSAIKKREEALGAKQVAVKAQKQAEKERDESLAKQAEEKHNLERIVTELAAIKAERDVQITIAEVVFKFSFIKGGSFSMGCHKWAGICAEDEKPARTVRVENFYLGQTEVTQGQWEAVMGDKPSHVKKGDNYPVERVSWLTVQKFIDKLNKLTEGHYGFSLPTEAEWEYAARNGGKKIAYPWGDEVPVCRKGAKNGAKFNDTNKKDCNLTLTEPVESYAANKLGLYGMAGNVWEWTCSEYEEKYGEQETKCSSKNDNEGRRVLRGGSWRTKPKYMRAASRYDQSPDNRSANIGFRVALRAK